MGTISEIQDRPRSTRVEVVRRTTNGGYRWELSISDLLSDEADALLARLTYLDRGGFNAYLEANPHAGRDTFVEVDRTP